MSKEERRGTRSIMLDSFELKDGKKKFWRDLSLVGKVTIMVALLVLTVLGASIYVSRSLTADFMEEANNDKIKAIAETMSSSIKSYIDDKSAIRRLKRIVSDAEKKHKGKGFEHIYVLDSDLKILAAMARDGQKIGNTYDFTEISDLKAAKTINRWENTVAAAPILLAPPGKPVMTLGTVVIEYNDSPIIEVRKEIDLHYLIIFLVASMLVMIGFPFFAGQIFKPIKGLEEMANKVADGDYEAQVQLVKGHSDVARILKSFQKLLVSIRIYVEFSSPSFVAKVREGKIDPTIPVMEKQTIGLCDAVDFSDWSEGKLPDDIAEQMDTYFEIHGRVAEEFGGEIEKYMGDSVMDYYGEGEKEEELFARNAIMAKFATQQFFSIANRFFHDDLQREILQWRYAAATGNIQKGPLGYSKKRDYTRMGVTVNLAARLEGREVCDSGGLVIDKFTFKNAGGRKYLIAEGPTKVKVKGFKKDVEVYKIVGFKDPAANERIKEVMLKLFEDEGLRSMVFCKVEFNQDDTEEKKKEKIELRREKEEKYQEFIDSFVKPYLDKTELRLPVPAMAA